MNSRSRWIVIAAVAGAAAGGAAWGVRRGRASARPEAVEPPDVSTTPLPAPENELRAESPPVAQDHPRRRKPLVFAAGFVAAAIGITTVAVVIHRSADDPLADQTLVTGPAWSTLSQTFNPYLYGLTPTLPTWTPTSLPSMTLPSMTLPPTTLPSSSPPTPVPVGGVLPPNGSVIMPGDSGEKMELTVERISNPAPPVDPDNPSSEQLIPRLGYRLISVTVEVKNVGGVPFLTDVEKHAWLVDKAGTTYSPNVEMTQARQRYPASQLDPAWWTGRQIVFEVKGSADLTRFRISTHPGKAKQTQDWRLS